MLTISIILAVVAVTAAVVVMIMKGNKGESTESVETKATEAAEKMSGSEKESLIKRFSGKSVPCKVTDHVVAQVDDLSIVNVRAYGIRYTSASDAIERSTDLTDNDALCLLTLDKELEILRKNKFDAERHYKMVDSAFFGRVYSYNDCTIGIITTEGKWANKPARMAIRIERDEVGAAGVTELYLATDDIAKASSHVRFDFNDEKEFGRFETLVFKNDEYKEEKDVLQEIFSRIAKYDYLISEGLLEMKGSKFVFKSPTEKQLKELAKIDKTLEVPSETKADESKVVNMFEHMHSSAE